MDAFGREARFNNKDKDKSPEAPAALRGIYRYFFLKRFYGMVLLKNA
jgi:hypothetical protein